MLEPLDASYVPAYLDLVEGSRAELEPWLSWVRDVRSIADVETPVAAVVETRNRTDGDSYAVLVDCDLAGLVNLRPTSRLHAVGTIRYAVYGPEHHDRGRRRSSPGFFPGLAIHRLELYTATHNVPSSNGAEKPSSRSKASCGSGYARPRVAGTTMPHGRSALRLNQDRARKARSADGPASRALRPRKGDAVGARGSSLAAP